MWQFIKTHPLLLLMSLAFAALALSLIITSGRLTCESGVCEMQLAEWQMHDSLWHISLAKLSFSEFPFRNPFYSGTNLSGYNYGIDLFLYGLSKVGIDPFIGYFWILPIMAVTLYIYFSWIYLSRLTRGRLELYLTAFFLYFASSMSYLAALYATGSINGSTLRGFPVVTSLHPPSMLLNLPYAFSLSFLLMLIIWLRTSHEKISSVSLILWSFLVFGLKFYAGVTGLLLLILFSQRSNLIQRLASFGLGSSLAYLLFYYRGGGGELPFVWDPLAIAHIVIDDIHLFYSHSTTLARYYLYENMTALPLRLIAIESLTVFLLFVLNWGVKGLTFFAPLFQPVRPFNRNILITALILGLIPVFFVQSGGWYNTMQFMYYSTFLLSLTTASVLTSLYHVRPRLGMIVIFFVVLLLLPTTVEQLRYPRLPHNVIESSELRALTTLREAPTGVVHVNRPWAKRALIPAIAEKEMYYLDTDQLMLFLPNYTERLEMVQKYDGGSINQIPADYYFIYKNEVASEDSVVALMRNKDLVVIFDSPEIIIFRRVEQMIQ